MRLPELLTIPNTRRIAAVIRAAAIAFVLAAPVGLARTADETTTQLNLLLADLPEKQAICSAMVVELASGKVVLNLNADRKLIPASNQKLWVLAAAAVDLGESFVFRTILAAKDEELYVIGSGDPGFGDARLVESRGGSITGELERWASVLAASGLKNPGDRLVFDDTLFDRQWTHPSWEARHLQKAYAAPVSALIINNNCIDVTLRPAEKVGEPVGCSMVPPNDAVEIVNRCLSGGNGEPIINRPGPEMRFVISRRCGKKWEFPPVAVSDPVALFAGAFRQVLRDRGLAVDPNVRTGRVRLPDGNLPPDLRILAEYRTPLPEVLGRIGKNSQNLFSEALLKRLGYEWSRRTGSPHHIGSWETGRLAVLDFARRARVPLEEPDFDDASGLSRGNRMSAAQAVGLLSYMYHHPSRDLFVSSLALAGRDGSLKRRMAGLAGTVHAKTGYLNGVRTLSGYVVTPSGRWFAFSVLFNGIKGATKPFNDIHDQVCRLLADWSDSPES